MAEVVAKGPGQPFTGTIIEVTVAEDVETGAYLVTTPDGPVRKVTKSDCWRHLTALAFAKAGESVSALVEVVNRETERPQFFA
jgi:hypothetical protein